MIGTVLYAYIMPSARIRYVKYHMLVLKSIRYLFERLPRPDEILRYEPVIRNATKTKKNTSPRNRCQFFVTCAEWLKEFIFINLI